MEPMDIDSNDSKSGAKNDMVAAKSQSQQSTSSTIQKQQNSAASSSSAQQTMANLGGPSGEPVSREFIKELDEWIAQLYECKQLSEGQVKHLCDKVCPLEICVKNKNDSMCKYEKIGWRLGDTFSRKFSKFPGMRDSQTGAGYTRCDMSDDHLRRRPWPISRLDGIVQGWGRREGNAAHEISVNCLTL
jgi:hypothetical protein